MGLTTQKGELGEAMVLADLQRKGYGVAIPFGHDLPFDLILIRKDTGDLERVQCNRVHPAKASLGSSGQRSAQGDQACRSVPMSGARPASTPIRAAGSGGYAHHSFAGVAQSAEHQTRNLKAKGSIPFSGSIPTFHLMSMGGTPGCGWGVMSPGQ